MTRGIPTDMNFHLERGRSCGVSSGGELSVSQSIDYRGRVSGNRSTFASCFGHGLLFVPGMVRTGSNAVAEFGTS